MKSVLDAATKFMTYDMIVNHTELPNFPHYRSELLYTLLKYELPEREDIYTLATALVQLGLDTHEMVGLEQDHTLKEMRSKQLKVLAGAYFSSRFYQLLSSAGHIDMVRQLSAAVCEVNQMKMNLYENLKKVSLTAEDYLNQMVQIRSRLYLSFVNLIHKGKSGPWGEIIKGFTRCEILHEELSQQKQNEHSLKKRSYGFWLLREMADLEEFEQSQQEDKHHGLFSLFSKYKLFQRMQDQLQVYWEDLDKKLQKLDSPALIRELQHLSSSFMKHQAVGRNV